MSNVQLYFAIGIPTSSVLVGIVIGMFQSSHALNQSTQALNQINLRFTSLETTMNSRFSKAGSIRWMAT